jgi:hypothetical protein
MQAENENDLLSMSRRLNALFSGKTKQYRTICVGSKENNFYNF